MKVSSRQPHATLMEASSHTFPPMHSHGRPRKTLAKKLRAALLRRRDNHRQTIYCTSVCLPQA